MINLKNTKICLYGIQGSGKTYFAEKRIVKTFRHPIIYLMHQDEFQNCHPNAEIISPKNEDGTLDASTQTLNKWAKMIKERANKGEVDAFIIDESDLFIPKDFRQIQKYSQLHDLIINHRHYGLAMVFITRRPQELPTVIVEQSEHTFIFAIDGKNVREHLSKLHKDMGRLLDKLSKNEHNFIYKTLGKPPMLYNHI